MKIILRVLLLMLIVLLPLSAQNSGGGMSGGATYNTNKNIPTFPVQIWGEVARPGIFDIPIGTDFLGAISHAGGPTDMAKLTDVRLIRSKLLEGDKSMMVKVDVEEYLLTGERSNLPEIRPGDTIIVSPRFMKGVRTTMTYIQSILSIINVIVLMQYYSGR